MPIEIRTVDGVPIASLKKFAKFYFGTHIYENLVEKNAEIIIYLDGTSVTPEQRGRFEKMVEKFEVNFNIKIKVT